jgi:hypothetical protein
MTMMPLVIRVMMTPVIQVMSAESLQVMTWLIDASFAVHLDFKSHTGSTMSWGKAAAQAMSRRQKLRLNTFQQMT